jgi:hypothetical protein
VKRRNPKGEEADAGAWRWKTGMNNPLMERYAPTDSVANADDGTMLNEACFTQSEETSIMRW